MDDMLHHVKAYLYKNCLNSDAENFVAHVDQERTLNVKDICESAIERGGANISASTLEHCANVFLREMGYLLCDGFPVNTGYFRAGIDIRGVFDNPAEKFVANKHSVYFNFKQGNLLRNKIANVHVDVLGVAQKSCYVDKVVDVKTGSVNDSITIGRNLQIFGAKIKIAGSNPDVGIYFVNQSTNQIIKVDDSDIVVNLPSQLYIVVPQLTKGTYSLMIKTQFSRAALLKKPRLCMFDIPLKTG